MYGLSLETEANHGGEGGLFNELLWNKDFESLGRLTAENSKEPDMGSIAPWFPFGGAKATLIKGGPYERNTHAIQITTSSNVSSGVVNPGYHEGLPYVGNISYFVSFMGKSEFDSVDIKISLQCPTNLPTDTVDSGSISHKIITISKSWKQFNFTLETDRSIVGCKDGYFAVIPMQASVTYFDMFSLVPSNSVSGLFRPDLFTLLKDYNPSFVRIPGGNALKVISLLNRWNWKDSIGPFEERVGHFDDLHGHWCTNSFGLYEMLVLNERLGTKTILSLYLGSDGTSKYPDTNLTRFFSREAIDLLEYCTGPEDSFWGKKRAAAGHPNPFNIHAVQLGSQEHDMSRTGYPLAYKIFKRVIQGHHPNLTIISSGGVYGPESDKVRSSSCLPCVGGCGSIPQLCNFWSESIFEDQTTIASLHNMYDDYWTSCKTTTGGICPLVFSEIATIDRESDLTSGIAESLFLVGAERNSDVVKYIATTTVFYNLNTKHRYRNRHPLLLFNGTTSFGSSSYHAQLLLKQNLGQYSVPVDVIGHVVADQNYWSSSASMSNKDGKLMMYVKVVNYSPGSSEVRINLDRQYKSLSVVTAIVLTNDDPDTKNSLQNPFKISPSPHGVRLVDSSQISTELGAYSLVIVVLSVDNNIDHIPEWNDRSSHAHLPPPLPAKKSFVNITNLLQFLFITIIVLVALRMKYMPKRRRIKAR